MKSYLLPAWMLFVLVGSLFAVSPTQAQHGPGPIAGIHVTQIHIAHTTADSSTASASSDIYTDALRNNWQNYSWATVDLANAVPVYKGAASMAVNCGPWQALFLYRKAFHTTPYGSLTFWINGGPTGGQKLQVQAVLGGHSQLPVPLSPLPANAWTQVTLPLAALGAANQPNMNGFWIQDTTGTTQPTFYVDEIHLRGSAQATPPPAPTGLTANGRWLTYCATCQMPMAHVILNWNPVPNALSYTIYRNGTPLQAGVTSPNYTDMTVDSGQTYTYTVCAVGTSGVSPQSAPASATAPTPPAAPLPPTDLAVQGILQGGNGTDSLSWSPVSGAVSYNVYQYDILIGSSPTPNFTVPLAQYNCALTYTVTAVNAAGAESLPSAMAGAQQTFAPGSAPSWVSSAAPSVPSQVAATAQWNAGQPRILLTWCGDGTIQTYNVYRDGALLAKGVWTLYYIDSAVQPGETHSYAVTGVNTYWPGTVESAQTASVTAQALLSAPTPLTTQVTITKIIPNDDSAAVFFNEVPGAADYRIYDIHNPGKIKYAGVRVSKIQGLGEAYTPIPFCIEWNGIDPAQGADLVVEAVDKPGPFQKMDGVAGPGAMAMDGSMLQAINGQGDPSNVPNVLASSGTFHVNCQPVSLAGSQVFFDNFQNEPAFAALPMPARDGRGPFYGLPGDYMELGNANWTIKHFGTDLVNTQTFVMDNHFMDTVYDGGGPGSSESPHNNNASLVFQPKATADISGGKVLHVTFEVDAHFDSRRWVNLFVGPAGDTLLNPGKFDESDGGNNRATASGQMVRWMIKNAHDLSLYNNGQKTDLIQSANWTDGYSMARVGWDGSALANGTTQDIDKRHRFDFYLSTTHYRIVETSLDGTYNIVRDMDFPAGASLPFTNCQVYFVHEVYHTGNDRPEVESYDPFDPYWYNNRPYADERHWDNMGQEVLNAFPALPGH